jgi:hypothetical protein
MGFYFGAKLVVISEFSSKMLFFSVLKEFTSVALSLRKAIIS